VKAEGAFVDGRMLGPWRWWRENGAPMQEGAFDEEERKTGIWKRYYPDGALMDEGEFRAGKKSGEWTSYAPTAR
jgi:antitoxin component YwqK of YwqJK toxin-antitoxin module